MTGSPADPRTVEGTVTAQLPSALYRVALAGGREVTAHLSGDPRRNFIRVLVGDRVRVALAPGDLTRGRIVERVGQAS
jgi:translation initiation factor IF-1